MKLILLALIAAIVPAGGHDHFAAGIVDSNHNGQADAGEPLQFVGANGTDHIFHLLPRPTGFRPVQRCGGFYMLDEKPRTLFPTDSFSIVALSDGQFDVAAPNHAHTGAWIWVEIVSVSGPAGAHFGFWDEEFSYSSDTPSVSLAANEPTGNPQFVISEGIDEISQDPDGHIHGRSWTADKAGDYYVGFRLIDRSTTGPGGGPWHPPSQIYLFHFKAGPDFQAVGKRVAGTGFVLTWPSQMGIWEPYQTGIVFDVLRSTTGSDWASIGTVTGTTADTVTFTDPSPPVGKAFYRLSYDWADPISENPAN